MTSITSCDEVLSRLKSLANPANVAGMARYGINPHNTYGVSIPIIRQLAREIGRSHELALRLWESEIHEARILAPLIEIPSQVNAAQMDHWTADFDSWDICDQCCSNLYTRIPLAYVKADEWSQRDDEFVKRAGYVLMACLAVKDKKAEDRQFEPFFVNIKLGSVDNRNLVKKAVSWALRQIGKRNISLNQKAIELAEEIRNLDSSSARWIATDVLRELTGPAVQARLRGKN